MGYEFTQTDTKRIDIYRMHTEDGDTDGLISSEVRTLRLALRGTVPLTIPGQGVTPLDPESPHAYWLLQNRAASAPLAVRPAVGIGALRCTSSLCRLAQRHACDFMAFHDGVMRYRRKLKATDGRLQTRG
jgi:hypothetical protein